MNRQEIVRHSWSCLVIALSILLTGATVSQAGMANRENTIRWVTAQFGPPQPIHREVNSCEVPGSSGGERLPWEDKVKSWCALEKNQTTR